MCVPIIGVRGFPHGVFNPWVRWERAPESGRSFRVALLFVVVGLPKCGKYKNKILDESYLEQRSRISSFAVALGISLRFFLAIPPKVHFKYSARGARNTDDKSSILL